MPQSSPDHSSANSLHCTEDAGDVVSWDAEAWISDHPSSSSSSSSLSPHSQPYDSNTITELIFSEPHHMPRPDYRQRCRARSIDVTARQDSINWILKVHGYYGFRAVTALLSVNYFDRILSSYSLPHANGWPFQLLSVACLSLAAKMEEPDVPLLLHFQVFQSRFVFEPGTVQKMELWVMSSLGWRLRSITPFDYLDYFISKLPSSSTPKPRSFSRIFSASSDLILSTTRVIDFLGFPPSIIAAAAVRCTAAGSFDGQPPVCFHEGLNEEMVRSCHQLMDEYLVDTCPAAPHKDRRFQPPAAPPSPVGVLDAAACGSCDTRSENPGSTSRDEPPPKRLRPSASDVQQP